MKDISRKCKCRFDGRESNSYQWWNNNKYQCECKKCYVCEKNVWNPATCSSENGKYLASIMDNSAIICDEVIDAGTKSNDEAKWYDETNFNEKKTTCKKLNFHSLLAFLLIAIALLIAVIIYCDFIKYQAKRKRLLREVLC